MKKGKTDGRVKIGIEQPCQGRGGKSLEGDWKAFFYRGKLFLWEKTSEIPRSAKV